MVKGQRRAVQTSGYHHQPPQPEMAEGEPQVDLGEEEMDVETFKNVMTVMQEELVALRTNQETVIENHRPSTRRD